MLACVAGSMLWMNNWQVQSFRALDSHRTTVKTSELAHRNTFIYFLSKYRFAIFMSKIIHSTLHVTLYVANLGIDVIIIGVAQQQKPKFSHPYKILTELRHSPSKNIPFFQNAHSRFLLIFITANVLGVTKQSNEVTRNRVTGKILKGSKISKSF